MGTSEWGMLQGPRPAMLTQAPPPQAATALGAAVTLTRAAATAPQGSAGSAATPAASSIRCLFQAGLWATASTVKVRSQHPTSPHPME